MKEIVKVLILLVLSVSINSSQIATNLWSKETLAPVHYLNFIDDQQMILSTEKGELIKMDARNGAFTWKKNLIYDIQFLIATFESCKSFV